ncbi:MAG: hypothetical protein GY782_08615 [Gammaproteobacteria bacterium]|nr:hypothetical protein [Gammaproteobacteria bacterium]
MNGILLKPLFSVTSSDKIEILIKVERESIDFDLIDSIGKTVNITLGASEVKEDPLMDAIEEIRSNVRVLVDSHSIKSWETEEVVREATERQSEPPY